MSLCVGISLPTNAAVSVSDGSAFVTKAEFSADLNNLSNRMAQLENSLDAKIDSLVSSYLTRNGIWNGASQVLLQDNFKYGFRSSSTRNSTFKKDFNIFNGTNYQNQESLFDYNIVGDYNRVKLIDNINKSGMLFFNTYSGTSINGNMTTLPVSTTDRINLANVRWIYEVKYDFEKSTNNSYVTMATISAQLIGFGIGTYLYCPNLPVGSITFLLVKEMRYT